MSKAALIGVTPAFETRPSVGRMPTSPLTAAGRRTEPPVSVPRLARAMPAATATADPPLEPPGMRSRSQTLWHVPHRSLWVMPPRANSARFDLGREDGARLAQPRDHEGVPVGHVVLEVPGAGRGAGTGGVDVVLQRHGPAVQLAERPAVGNLGVALFGPGQRLVVETGDDGMQPGVEPVDLGQGRARHLDARSRAAFFLDGHSLVAPS